MARIENHKYSIEESFRECFYIVRTTSESMSGRIRRSTSCLRTSTRKLMLVRG